LPKYEKVGEGGGGSQIPYKDMLDLILIILKRFKIIFSLKDRIYKSKKAKG